MRTLLILMSFVLVIGCSKSKTETPATTETSTTQESKSPEAVPRLDANGVLLEQGRAALVVAFPEVPEGGEWLSMVTLKGDHDTDWLPRIPLASSHSVTVLNIPPGRYEVDAKAWVRKTVPYAGGISDTVALLPGELLILKAPTISDPSGSVEGVKLSEAGRKTWSLKSPRDISKYIAEAASSARG
ncbi:MAG: hypothetical protein KDB65_06495 [Calditrichaeota bacterium]|nr:hypothetical protein [Calditrichota bacterium]MCB9369758.1 hypothetical protein [Calditrichota bacterium]